MTTRQVFAIAAIITAALSLDATVVLLTPVVLITVRRLRTPMRPYAYATAHLANAASLLLPVSNLTNLLGYHVANISFARFTAVMALPWLAAVAAVYVVFRLFFARDLRLAPDIGRKLRTARNVRDVLRQIREAEREQ